MWSKQYLYPVQVLLVGLATILVFGACSLPNTPAVGAESFDNNSVKVLELYPSRKYVSIGDSVPLRLGELHRGYDCGKVTDISIAVVQDTLSATWSLEWPKNYHNCKLLPAVDSLGDSIVLYSFSSLEHTEGTFYLKGDSIGDSTLLIANDHRVSFFANILDSNWIDSVGGIQWSNGKPLYTVDSLRNSAVNVLELSGMRTLVTCGDSLSYAQYCANFSKDSVFVRLETVSRTSCVGTDTTSELFYEESYYHVVPEQVVDSSSTCFETLKSL